MRTPGHAMGRVYAGIAEGKTHRHHHRLADRRGDRRGRGESHRAGPHPGWGDRRGHRRHHRWLPDVALLRPRPGQLHRLADRGDYRRGNRPLRAAGGPIAQRQIAHHSGATHRLHVATGGYSAHPSRLPAYCGRYIRRDSPRSGETTRGCWVGVVPASRLAKCPLRTRVACLFFGVLV